MDTLKGICAASVTPFNDYGKIDELSLKKHLDYLVESGVHIILVCSGTGEFAFLRENEKKYLAEIAGNHLKKYNVKFMVQTSAINTEETIEFSKHAEDQGADGLLVLPPYFEGPGEDGVFYHFEKISKNVNVPVMVYNIPQYTNFVIRPEFFKRLLELDHIDYIKDSSEDYFNLLKYLNITESRDSIFNGFDATSFEALMAGAGGCVLGMANIIPKSFVKLYNLMTQNKYAEAKELWDRMLPLNLFICSNPFSQAVKAATNMNGSIVGKCRKPLEDLPESVLREMRMILDKYKLQ